MVWAISTCLSILTFVSHSHISKINIRHRLPNLTTNFARSNPTKLWLQKKDSGVFDDSAFGSFQEGFIPVIRGDSDSYSLYFRLYERAENPSIAKDNSQRDPLVILHGGPSLPSQYLYPILSEIKGERPVLFYDQLGCGRSDEPKNKKFYSISESIQDLHIVLENTVARNHDHHDNKNKEETKIHLLGHSYGGVLAYEFAKQQSSSQAPKSSVCCYSLSSLILSNAPTNMKQAGKEYDRLFLRNPIKFWKERVCRVTNGDGKPPPALEDALEHVGTVWAGMDEVIDYVATPMIPTEEQGIPLCSSFPPSLVMKGKFDFAFTSSEGWSDLLLQSTTADPNNSTSSIEEVTFDNCAHYPFLEDPKAFGDVLRDFLSRHDSQCQVVFPPERQDHY